MSDPSIVRFRAILESGLAALEARREEVNELNVFPVADGDTGDNMVLTLRAVVAELDRQIEASRDRTIDDIGRDEIVASVARAALLGARGNSGVILSQLIRGAAEELASRPGELVDPVLIGAALARAADQAYGSVREPAEGTILTVVREMAARVASELAHMDDARLAPLASDAEQNAAIASVIERALEAGEASVARGPDRLPVLREAGVVDAGGHGVTVLLAGIVGALRGSEPPGVTGATRGSEPPGLAGVDGAPRESQRPAPAGVAGARVTYPQHSSTTFRYCTNFAVTGAGLDARRFTSALEAIGDSVLVVGDPTTLKVHLHTDDPRGATALFTDAGRVSHLDVADMREQVRRRDERLIAAAPPAVCGALAVVTGDGMRGLFASLGIEALDGGSAMTASVYDLLAAIHAIATEEVVVLPNSPSVLVAARRAASLSEKRVCVVGSRSPQAGLAAAVALDPSVGASENAAAMEGTLERVRTGAVAAASRDDLLGRFRAGDAVGYVEEEIVAWGGPREALRAVLERLARDDAELITCLRGVDVPLDDDTVAALAAGEAEFELSVGGQRTAWWLLAAE